MVFEEVALCLDEVMMGLVPSEEEKLSVFLRVQKRGFVSNQWEGSHVQARRGALTKIRSAGTLILNFPTSWTVRNIGSLSHPIYSILL